MASWEPDPMQQQAMTQFVLGRGPMANPNPYAPTFGMQQYQTFGQPNTLSEDQLDYGKDYANYQQDMFDLQFSPEVAMLSGAAGIPHEAFEPTVTYEAIPRPGTDFLQRQIQQEAAIDPTTGMPIIDPTTGQPVRVPSQVQSYSGIVADEIMNGSGNSASAMAKIRQIIAQGQDAGASTDPSDPAYDPQYAALVNSMPTMYDTFGEPQIDWMTAQGDAQSWEQAYYEDPRPGPAGAVYDSEGNMISGGEGTMELQYDSAGNQILVKKTEEPTPVMEMFAEYGLPSPYDRYEAADFMGPDWEAGASAYYSAIDEQKNRRAALRAGRPELRAQKEALNQAQQDWDQTLSTWQGNVEGGEYGNRVAEEIQARLQHVLGNQPGTFNAPGTIRTGGGFNVMGGPVVPGSTTRTAPYEPEPGVKRLVGPEDADYRKAAAQWIAGGGTVDKGEWIPYESEASYAKPGSTLAEFLQKPAPEKMPQEMKKQRKQLQAQRKEYKQQKQAYQGEQQTFGEMQTNLGGAKQELFGADYGHALATQWIAQQQGQTPYTDALMARRMVPLAAGVSTGAWVPGM